jgi:hypothetical protein
MESRRLWERVNHPRLLVGTEHSWAGDQCPGPVSCTSTTHLLPGILHRTLGRRDQIDHRRIRICGSNDGKTQLGS